MWRNSFATSARLAKLTYPITLLNHDVPSWNYASKQNETKASLVG